MGEERVAEQLLYSRCFDLISSQRGGKVIVGLVSAPDEKLLIEDNIVPAAKAQALAHLKADKQ
jgi:hypothetical protein